MRALRQSQPDPAEQNAGGGEELGTEIPADSSDLLSEPAEARLAPQSTTIERIGLWLQDLSSELERRIPASADEAGGGSAAVRNRELVADTLKAVSGRFLTSGGGIAGDS